MQIIKNSNLIEEKEWKDNIKKLYTDFNSLETNKERAKRVLKDCLTESIKNTTTGNFGIAFSGGIDSTLIAFIAKKLNLNFNCYSVGIENSQDIEWAKNIADSLKLNLKFRILTLEELEITIKKVTQILKEPDVMKVSVGSVLYATSLLAKKDGVGTLLTGLGSEELFAGYQRHEETLLNNNFEALHKECFNGLLNMWERDLKRDFLISKEMNINLKIPLLDENLIKAGMQIHPMHKLDKENKKIIIRELAEDLGLPKEFAWRKKKAAQYGSNFIRGLDKLTKKNGFEKKKDYLQSL